MRSRSYSLFLGLILVPSLTAQTKPPEKLPANPVVKEELTLEKLFPREGLFGPSASGMAFSHDGKYAAYLHRTYKERRQGSDLWLLEVATGKTTRITTKEKMAKFQASARKVDDKPADEKREDRKPGERPNRYSGISGFTWSPNADELMFTSEGDIYRWKVGDADFKRLTMTRVPETLVRYFPDGKGYTYLRGESAPTRGESAPMRGEVALMRVVFGSDLVEQIDPKLPTGETLATYRFSPDGKLLSLVTRKANPTGNERKVPIANYRERFMKVNEVPRLVSDDPQPQIEMRVYLHRVNEPMLEDGDPSKIFEHKTSGPRDILTTIEWSPDSKKVAFGIFEQSTSQVRILMATAPVEPKKGEKPTPVAEAKVVHRFLHTGGPTTPSMMQPRFLDDSRRLVFLSEQSGFRHLHTLDPLYEQLDQVTFGRCEVYPVELSKDKKHYYVLATKEHPSCRDIYKVNLTDRKMERVSTSKGAYENAVVSPDGTAILTELARYGSCEELCLIRTACCEPSEKAITDSHPESTKKLVSVKPEMITYQNRHGHDIHGFLFKPTGWTKDDKRPLLIYVYGGPLGRRKQVVEGNYQSDAYLFARYMAEKHGYVTCTIDPRGMSGYGGAFEKANYEQVGKPQVEDLVDGVKHLIANYGVDPKRVGMHGWSFGGFQTQMCMYTAPDVFAAGIAGAGPTEWENYNSWYSTGTIGPSKTGQPDLSKFSLLPLAKNLKGKLLLVHGMEDPNVLYQDTVRVYRELLKAGKETLVELFLDPTGGHGLGGDINPLAKARKYEEFFVRTLGKGTPATMGAISAK